MFKNIGKKILAVGFSFALCVPCCFASAQPPQYDEAVLFAAIRREVKLCAKEHNLVFTEHGEVVEPSQMNNAQLLSAYNLLVDRKIARDLEDLDYFTEPPQYDEAVLFAAMRREVELYTEEHNLVFTEHGEVVEPSQMNNEQLLVVYNWILDQEKARDFEDLDYFTQPPRLDVSLLNQDETIRKTIYGEVERCLEKFGMMPRYKGCFVDLCQMNNEQLMWFYNWLLDQGKARAFGLLMRN